MRHIKRIGLTLLLAVGSVFGSINISHTYHGARRDALLMAEMAESKAKSEDLCAGIFKADIPKAKSFDNGLALI